MDLAFMDYINMGIYVFVAIITLMAFAPSEKDEEKLALADDDPAKKDTPGEKGIIVFRCAVILLGFLFLSNKFSTTGEMTIEFFTGILRHIFG